MAFDASGIFTRLRGNTSWTGDRDAGTKIMAGLHDDNDNDLANGLTECITKTGKSLPTVDIPWNGKKILNLGAPVNPTDAATKAYVDAMKTFATGIVISGSVANGRVTFSGPGSNNGLAWTASTVDLSWIARAADWYTTGSAAALALNSKADGTGSDAVILHKDGKIVAGGRITTPEYVQATAFISPASQATIVANTTTAAMVYLRPSGPATDANESYFSPNTTFIGGGIAYFSGTQIGFYPVDFYMARSPSNRALVFYGGGSHYLQWQTSSGDYSFIQAGANVLYLQSSGKILIAYGVAYKPGGGAWTDSSDARIKDVLGDYEGGLAAINALRPVRFTYKGNDTREEPHGPPTLDLPPASDSLKQGRTGETLDPANPPMHQDTEYAPAGEAPYFNSGHYQSAIDGKEFIGLIAQEAEGPMPEIVTQREGYIDGEPVTDLRDIDQGPLVFALINAVKELSARIEALETA